MRARKGDWSQTFTGKRFYALDPRADDICIEDIAHALSLICRFGGHSSEFYSVAQHSILVAEVVQGTERDPNLGWDRLATRAGLLHDAAEAYVGDMVRPLKRSMHEFVAAEDRIFMMIAGKFGIPPFHLGCVKIADEVLLATEARDLMGGSSADKWSLEADPLDERIIPISPADAEKLFLKRFYALEDKP